MESRTGRRFTPHGIEDILRRVTSTVVDSDIERDSSQGGDRDSFGPLNLSKCYQTETDRYKVADEETEWENTKTKKILRRKKMRTTFTGRQIFELERMFETKKYLNAGERRRGVSEGNYKRDKLCLSCAKFRSS